MASEGAENLQSCLNRGTSSKVIRAAEHFRPRRLREATIEKDYFVTEALRIIEQAGEPRPEPGVYRVRWIPPAEGLGWMRRC